MSKLVQAARSHAMIQKVLDAAESLVMRQGIGSLTMDAVAAEGGMSKGGVMHHFRSKDALVEALVSRRLDLIESGLAQHRDGLPDGRARTLLGMALYGGEQYADDQGFPRALLVAAVENPQALGRFKALFADTMGAVAAEAGGRNLDTLLLFAVMGLLLTKTLGIGDLPPERAQDAFDAVRRWAGQAPGSIAPERPERPGA